MNCMPFLITKKDESNEDIVSDSNKVSSMTYKSFEYSLSDENANFICRET